MIPKPEPEPDEIDWGHEADVEIPDMKPMTQGEVDFWFEEYYPDGTPFPTHKIKKPN